LGLPVVVVFAVVVVVAAAAAAAASLVVVVIVVAAASLPALSSPQHDLNLNKTGPLEGPSRSGATQRWWQAGRVYPRFVDSRSTHRSDWEDFQVHRKILGVLSPSLLRWW